MKKYPKISSPSKSTENCFQNSPCRLSKQFLHDLRNRIPIKWLIEEKLDLRSHTDGRIFRFECPQCSGFHTSVMQNKNLARCFDCKKNYNPIDMVMAVKKTEFLQCTQYLANFMGSAPPINNRSAPGNSEPERIGKVLFKSHIVNTLPIQKLSESRIQDLEKEIDTLKYRFDKLQQFIVNVYAKRR